MHLAINFIGGQDYEKLERARKLKETEYTIHPQLGYISLNQALNNDEVLEFECNDELVFDEFWEPVVYTITQISLYNRQYAFFNLIHPQCIPVTSLLFEEPELIPNFEASIEVTELGI